MNTMNTHRRDVPAFESAETMPWSNTTTGSAYAADLSDLVSEGGAEETKDSPAVEHEVRTIDF